LDLLMIDDIYTYFRAHVLEVTLGMRHTSGKHFLTHGMRLC